MVVFIVPATLDRRGPLAGLIAGLRLAGSRIGVDPETFERVRVIGELLGFGARALAATTMGLLWSAAYVITRGPAADDRARADG